MNFGCKYGRTVFDTTKKVLHAVPMVNGRIEPEVVVIKAFGGFTAIRWMVGMNERVAYVTNAAGREAAKLGAEPMAVVGVPLADVFKTSPGIKDDEYPNWELLERRFPGLSP
jgi:hypothetical protein